MGSCCFGFCVEEEDEEKVIVNKTEAMNTPKVRSLRGLRFTLRTRSKVRLKGHRDKRTYLSVVGLLFKKSQPRSEG